MKITARLTFIRYNQRECLVQAFFDNKEFSPLNKLRIMDDRTAFIELEFDSNPPQEICKAMSICKIECLDNTGSYDMNNLLYEYYAERCVRKLVSALPVSNDSEDTVNNYVLPDEPANNYVAESDKGETFADDSESEVMRGAGVEDIKGADVENKEFADAESEEVVEAKPEEPTDVAENEMPVEEGPEEEPNDKVEEYVASNDESIYIISECDEVDESIASAEVCTYDLDAKSEAKSCEKQDVQRKSEECDATAKEIVVEQKIKKKSRRGLVTPSEDDYLDIPEFKDIVASVSNFVEFTSKVVDWLGMSGEDAGFLEGMIIMLSMIEQKGYELRTYQIKSVTEMLEKSDYSRIKLARLVSTRLESKGIYSTFLPFVATVLRYKDSFHNVSDDADNQENSEDDANKKSNEAGLMDCEKFASILNDISNKASIDEKVKMLLLKMGLKKTSERLYNEACKIVITALSMDALESIDDVMMHAGMNTSTKDGMRTKIKFSEWINNYNKENHIRKMKVIAFLRELKSIFA